MRGCLMISTTLAVALLNHLTRVVRVDQGIDPTKPWDVVKILCTRVDTSIPMQLWKLCAEHFKELLNHIFLTRQSIQKRQGVSIAYCSPTMMAKLTRWNMSAIISR